MTPGSVSLIVLVLRGNPPSSCCIRPTLPCIAQDQERERFHYDVAETLHRGALARSEQRRGYDLDFQQKPIDALIRALCQHGFDVIPSFA
jgi:hypothetical protein